MPFETALVLSLAVLAALVVLSAALLRAWSGWLALKRLELERGAPPAREGGGVSGLIELSDLKERLRKLEAIAAGVDL